MRLFSTNLLVLALFTASMVTPAQAQRMQQREKAFLKSKPLIGAMLPDVTVYSPDGTPFRTADLRGHYTVLTFGCLT